MGGAQRSQPAPRPRFAEAWLVAVLDSLSEGVLAIAQDGALVAANPAAEAMLDFSIGALRGRPWTELRWKLVDEDGTPVPLERHPVAATLGDGVPRRDLVHGLTRGGQVARWINVSTHLLPHEYGGPGGTVVSFADVTDRIEAQRTQREFLSITSHELRTPVATLLGMAELLETSLGEASAETLHEYVGVIARQARHLRRLVDDLLVAARLNSGSLVPKKDAIDVGDLVRSALDGLPGSEAVEVNVPAGTAVAVDPDHGRRILLNLLENALKYGAPPVVVAASRRDGQVEVSVADRGSGVPEDFVPRLFEHFSQAAPDGSLPGTGLGLAIVAGLAQLNGGSARHEAVRPHGARFVVTLPAAASTPDPRPSDAAPSPS